MPPRALCFAFVLSMFFGQARAADAIRSLIEALHPTPAQFGICTFDPEHVVLDTWPDGSPRTVAATYLTDSDCATSLGIFRVQRNGRLKELDVYDGMPRRLRLLDVTGNGVPEILATERPGNRSAGVAILRWDGAKLTRIGITSDRATFVDLDHDGVLEIAEFSLGEWNRCGARSGWAHLQRLAGGKYVSTGNAALAEVALLTKSTAGRETITKNAFLPDDMTTRMRVKIINGTRGGQHRAEAVALRARRLTEEKEEPPPGRLLPVRATADDESAEGNVQLPSRCTMLDVVLDGPAGATVAVVLEPRRD